MADILNNIEELVDKDEKLIDIWGRRTPKFEKKYEQSVMRVISDYGVGASENTGAKGKILGAGYEPYIMAFFIGKINNFIVYAHTVCGQSESEILSFFLFYAACVCHQFFDHIEVHQRFSAKEVNLQVNMTS